MTRRTMNIIQGCALILGAIASTIVIVNGSLFAILGMGVLVLVINDAKSFMEDLRKDRALDDSVNRLLQEGRERRNACLTRSPERL